MEPFMALWVEEGAVVYLISASATSPLNMMAVPSCEFGNLAVAEGTEAALLFQEME
jgi:hypothetical protein